MNGRLKPSNGKEAAAATVDAATPESGGSSSTVPSSTVPSSTVPALGEAQRAHQTLSDVSNDSSQNGRDCDGPSAPERPGCPVPLHPPNPSVASAPSSHLRSRKKSKKHKDKERTREKEGGEEDCGERERDSKCLQSCREQKKDSAQKPSGWPRSLFHRYCCFNLSVIPFTLYPKRHYSQLLYFHQHF